MSAAQIFSRFTDLFRHLQERLIPVRPLRYRLSILRSAKQFAEWRVVPIACAQNYRDDDRFPRMMALHSPIHLDVVAIVRSDEVRADQQQDDLIAVNMLINGSIDFLASMDPSIMPSLDDSLPF